MYLLIVALKILDRKLLVTSSGELTQLRLLQNQHLKTSPLDGDRDDKNKSSFY